MSSGLASEAKKFESLIDRITAGMDEDRANEVAQQYADEAFGVYDRYPRVLWQSVFISLYAFFEEEMNNKLFRNDERNTYFIQFNLEGLLRGDIKSRYDAYAIGRQWGWLSVNDIRKMETLNDVDGGDVYLQPLNMVNASTDNPDQNAVG